MAYFPPTNSVVAFQSDPTKLVGTVSVAGVLQPHSVATIQGTNPWVVGNSSVTVMNAIPAHSISGVGLFQTIGSIQLLQGSQPIGSVGQAGNWYHQPASVQVIAGTAMTGSVVAYQGVTPWIVGLTGGSVLSTPGSVQLMAGTNMAGSVVAYQGVSPWIISGSTSVVGGPLNINSILATYGVNSVFATNNVGLAPFGLRNDFIASTISANKAYGPMAVDSFGRTVITNFAPNESSIFGHASVVNGGDSGSVLVIGAAGAGLRNYITDYQVSNNSSVNAIVTFSEGGGSILGRTIAPTLGGSNMPHMATPIRNQTANQPINMYSDVAASILFVTMYGFKAP